MDELEIVQFHQMRGLNVFINTKSMADRAYAESLNDKADQMLAEYTKKAEGIFETVKGRLR